MVAIASLKGGPLLDACLDALDRQTDRDFEVIVVDNSGTGAIESQLAGRTGVRVDRSARNVGFAAAMNRAWALSQARYLATLNDDVESSPQWLGALRRAMESDAGVGMCASRVRLKGTCLLDSAGMLIGGDGSSKQRGTRTTGGDVRRRG